MASAVAMMIGGAVVVNALAFTGVVTFYFQDLERIKTLRKKEKDMIEQLKSYSRSS